jgi:hypothetical protein
MMFNGPVVTNKEPEVEECAGMANETKAEWMLRGDLYAQIRVQYRDTYRRCDTEAERAQLECAMQKRTRDALRAFHEGAPRDLLAVLDNTRRLRFVYDHRMAFSENGTLEAALVCAWQGTRINNCQFDPTTLESIFLCACDRDRLRLAGDPLPHSGPFTIYRGVSGRGTLRRVRGLAWTASLDVACWFALRQEGGLEDPAVYKAQVHAEDVFFYTNGRHEQEFVCRPRRCTRMPLTEDEMKSRRTVRQAEMKTGKPIV